jgi:hypothetical protein
MAEHTAAGLSPAQVQAAVDLCSPGDTAVLPAGTYNGFNTGIHVPIGISLRGAGKGVTVLNKTSTTANSYIFNWPEGAGSSYPITIHGMTLHGADDQSTDDTGIYIDWVTTGTPFHDLKIYDMEIHGFGYAGIKIQGWVTGVIYDCDIINNYRAGYGYGIGYTGIYPGESSGHFGDYSWTTWPANTNPGWGGNQFLFIEDCYFSGNRHDIDGSWGAKYVARYNTCAGTNPGGWDAHINTHSRNPFDSGNRGPRATEIYHNTIAISHYEDGITTQNGDSLIWNNALTGSMSGGHGITLTDGAYTGDVGDYPASDQIRGSYVWGNTQNGVDCDSDNYPAVNPGVGNWAPLWLVKERDFHLHERSGYIPYTYPHPLRSGSGTSVTVTPTVHGGHLDLLADTVSTGLILGVYHHDLTATIPTCTILTGGGITNVTSYPSVQSLLSAIQACSVSSQQILAMTTAQQLRATLPTCTVVAQSAAPMRSDVTIRLGE